MDDEEILKLHAKNMTFDEIMILIGMELDPQKRKRLIDLLVNCEPQQKVKALN